MQIIFKTTHCNKYSLNSLARAIEDFEGNIFFERDIGKILKIIDENSLIVFSFMNMNSKKELSDAKRIKEIYPRSKIIAGGVYFTKESEEGLDLFDSVFIGEGEETFRDFLYGRKKEKIIKPTKEVDINKFGSVSDKFKRFGSIEISRGCHYGCFYCQTPQIFGNKMRHKTVDKIIEEVEILLRNNFRDIRFITPDLASYASDKKGEINIKEIKRLFNALSQIIKNRGRIFLGSFPSEIRPENITEDLAYELKKITSSKRVIIGAQSGSQDILKKINRAHSVDDILNAVKILSSFGFNVDVDFIFGFPFETEKDFKETKKVIDILVRLYKARIHIHYFMPLPSTPFENLKPKPLSREIKNYLSGLISSKDAYGQWEKQIAQSI
ncbi:MAG: TIGR04013 family B12-binding domain/radical SAM domain-containing protein [Elusimicrobiales bacterium]